MFETALDWYCRLSIAFMLSWVVCIVAADILMLFSINARREYGVRSLTLINWIILVMLLPVLNVVLMYVVYRLYNKGAPGDPKKIKQRKIPK